MNGKHLIQIMGNCGYSSPMNPHRVLPRYAAMCGFFGIPAMDTTDYRIYGIEAIEVPDEIVPKILALHFAEKATTDLREMGVAMGQMRVSVPSNINVWSHAKGERQLIDAANAMTKAAEALGA